MRRVQGVCIDAIVFMLIMAGALIIAVSFGSDNIARILGFTVAATWLLYEPVLVSMTGGTVGHYVYNMRVVDDRSAGNISFGKAVVLIHRYGGDIPSSGAPRPRHRFHGPDEGPGSGTTSPLQRQARSLRLGNAVAWPAASADRCL
jgi:hypothetical protein